MTLGVSLANEYWFRFGGGLASSGAIERHTRTSDGFAVSRFGYVLNDALLYPHFRRPLPPEVLDLIDLSAAVHLADSLAPRATSGDTRPVSERWHRRIGVEVPLRCMQSWNASDVRLAVEELLAYLSDDSWTFQPIPRTAGPRLSEMLNPLLLHEGRSSHRVLLHSGGLDSLYGLIEAATHEQVDLISAVSVVTNGRTINVLDRVLRTLRPLTSAEVERLSLKIRILGAQQRRNDRESTQRVRSLLFLAAGVAVAALSGVDQLCVAENGPGATNLPCTLDQGGARTTRAMHPKTLASFAALASRIIGRSISIKNSGLLSTKAELAKTLLYGDFLPIVAMFPAARVRAG